MNNTTNAKFERGYGSLSTNKILRFLTTVQTQRALQGLTLSTIKGNPGVAAGQHPPTNLPDRHHKPGVQDLLRLGCACCSSRKQGLRQNGPRRTRGLTRRTRA